MQKQISKRINFVADPGDGYSIQPPSWIEAPMPLLCLSRAILLYVHYTIQGNYTEILFLA
jgi:hypothetical protein